MLEFRPNRIRETPNRRRENFVVSVFPVAIEPHPPASPLDQPDLLRADVLIVALDIDGDDPHSTARGHDHVEAVIGDRDPPPPPPTPPLSPPPPHTPPHPPPQL